MASNKMNTNLQATSSDEEYLRDVFNGGATPKRKVTFNTYSSNNYVTNEAYKVLRTNLLFCGNDIKTIVITSNDANEGKSTVAAELVKSLAESGKKTLLLDADMRKSAMLRKNARATEIIGLSELLSGLAEPHDVVCATQHPNFDVVFAGRFPPNPVELIGNGRFKAVLDEFSKDYDYIIIDSPPLGMVIDAAVIASVCDGSIIVIYDKRVSRISATQIKQQLERSGCKILGAVINETKNKHSGRYSKRYYKYGYKYGYRYGYGEHKDK